MRVGDCVRLPDGRIARVRWVSRREVRVRVRRKTSITNQFVVVDRRDVVSVTCPKGWMTPRGYVAYLTKTLAKMRQREQRRVAR